MKKLMMAVFAVAAMTASAELYYATVNTYEWKHDPNPSKGNVSLYQGYLCTVESAQALFGSSTIGGVTSAVASDYIGALYALNTAAGTADSGVTALTQGEYVAGEYSFSQYFAAGLSGDYLAIVTYGRLGDWATRVFKNEAGTMDDGSVVFDIGLPDGGSAGAWTQAPEPTSGMLLLCGFALMALRRKQQRV